MNIRIKAVLILLATLFCTSIIQSQNSNKDVALWTSVGVDYTFKKRLKFILEQHLRLKENMRTTDEYFTELTIEYEILKNFEIGLGGRHITENDNQGGKQGFENHFRYNVDLSFKYKIERFTVSHRLRYQNENHLGVSLSDGDVHRENLRFRTGLDYNIRKIPLEPKLDIELFNRFNSEEDINYNKYRFTFGLSYNLKKFGKFEAYYRFENDVNTTSPNRLEVWGLQYRYSIN